MNRSRRSIHSVVQFVSLGMVLLLAIGTYAVTCGAHSPWFNPPNEGAPPPPVTLPPKLPPGGSGGNPGFPGRTKKPPKKTPQKPIGPVTGEQAPPTAPTPNVPGRGVTGSGASTKKARRGATSLVSWEHWWARNRFQFLDFPNIEEKSRKFPVTPRSEWVREKMEELRVESIELFRPLLSSSSARLRRASLVSLARLEDLESLPEMLKLLRDGNQTVRDSALLALGILGSGEANHTLLHIARGTDTATTVLGYSRVPDYFRGFAQVSLALEKVRGVGTVFQSIALDPSISNEVRAMALEGLGLFGGEASAKYLMDFADNPRAAPELLATAVAALGKTGESFTQPFLEKCLFSKVMSIRQSAALSLGGLVASEQSSFVKRLYRGYRHTNDQALKGFSLLTIGRVGGPEAVKVLDQAAMRGSSSDHAWACLGLGFALQKTKNEKVVDHLIHLAESHSNRSTRGAAAIALGLFKCKRAMADLIKMMREGDDPRLRGYCALALGMIGESEATAPLRLSLKKDAVHQVRSQAALALALLNDTSFAEELLDLLITSTNDTTKAFVALSLSFMADVRIVEKVHEKIGGKELDDITLLHCIHLVSKLLSGRAMPYLEPLAAGSNFATEYPLVRYLLEFDA